MEQSQSNSEWDERVKETIVRDLPEIEKLRSDSGPGSGSESESMLMGASLLGFLLPIEFSHTILECASQTDSEEGQRERVVGNWEGQNSKVN